MYRLAPTDSRYLDMTDEGIRLEYEMFLADRGKPLFVCPCGIETHEAACPACEGKVPVDDDEAMLRLIEKIQSGEAVDIEAEIKKTGE